MTLDKAGSGSVEARVFNAVVDALGDGTILITAAEIDSQAAQDGDVLTADGSGNATWEPGGGSQPLAYEVTLDSSNYPQAGAIFATGLMLGVGDRIIDFGISVEAGTTPTDWQFGKSPMSGAASKIGASNLNGNDENDGGPYTTDTSNAPHGVYASDTAGGQGRLPCTVLEAHELCVYGVDAIEDGSVTITIYLVRAAQVTTLTPEPQPLVTSYTPDTGTEDDPVVIHGTGFTGATDVIFGGPVSADAFNVDSDIQITTAVPAGAGSAAIVVEVANARSGDQPIFTVT